MPLVDELNPRLLRHFSALFSYLATSNDEQDQAELQCNTENDHQYACVNQVRATRGNTLSDAAEVIQSLQVFDDRLRLANHGELV